MTTENTDKQMTLFEHIEEMRTRLLYSLLAIIVLFFICFAFSEQLLTFLRAPLEQALPEQAEILHFTAPLEVFLANLKVSFLCALVFSCPIWLYHFWRFTAPALMNKERKYLLPFLIVSVALFWLGISFCYYVILPLALDFLISVGMKVGTPIIKVSDYISLLIVLIFCFGLVFETPLILVLLSLLGLVTADDLRKQRRFVLIGTVILAALLTPPDPISQIGLAVPIYAMYELSIIVIALIKKFS